MATVQRIKRKKMDNTTLWQWRFMLVKKYSRNPESFHYSNSIGLDYYVASERIKKVDLQSVTNGVILEVCDFAKTVIESRKHFITDILENNFDLGFEDEQQRIDFTARILHKVKDLMREVSPAKHEAFTLFNMSSKPQSTSNSENGLNMRSTETESFLEMDDPDESEQEDDLKCSELHLQKELLEDLPSSFPYCEEIGLNLDVGSEQSLDPGLFTKGAMLELVSFTRALTSSYSQIILDVLEHNFKLDLKDQQVKNRVWFNISNLLKRRKRLTTTGDKTSLEFENEPFSFQTNPFKGQYGQSDLKSKQQKRALMLTNEQVTKRCRREENTHMETNTFSHHTNLCTSGKEEDDVYDFCAPLESDLDLDEDPDSGNTCHLDVLQNSANFDIPKEPESSCMGMHKNFLPFSDDSSSVPPVNSNLKPPLANQTNKTGHCAGEEQAQTQRHRNAVKECDMEQEEIVTEPNMWKLRANRAEQIISPLNKEFGPFRWSSRCGVKFNVGFGPKQNISVDLLTHCVLLEVAKFALAINSSQQDFIMEILEYNFDLGLKSQRQRYFVACEIMKRVRQLRWCDDAVQLSDEVFELFCPIPSTTVTNPRLGSVIPELSVSNAETETHISCKSVNHYPACRGIGLKLHVNHCRPNKKLDINKLTNHAMTEVANFAEKLCGTFEQICLDVLRHNFNLDLLSGDSDPTKNVLALIANAVEQKNLGPCDFRNIGISMKRSLTVEKMDLQNNLDLEASGTGCPQAAIMEQNVDSSSDIKQKNEFNLKLWQLRTNQIQQILSLPHEKHCPLYSFSRCKKLGIDFNVGSGVKQNLDPMLLTNGIMVEFYTFAMALMSAKKHFITEILEFNFDLSFENELYRSAFTQQTWSRIPAINKIKRHLVEMPFELPDMRCIQEPVYDKATYCPRCYQDRNHVLSKDEPEAGYMQHPRPHIVTDRVSADASSTAQTPAKDLFPTIPTIEETIKDSYPLCKKKGLNLLVDKDQPRNKLDMHVLTRGIMNEVVNFATKLCGTKLKIIDDVLQHNFNMDLHSGDLYSQQTFKKIAVKDCGPAWFDDIFVIQPFSLANGKEKKTSSTAQRRNTWKESIQQRKLALQTKEEKAMLPSPTVCDVKSKKSRQNFGKCYPTCRQIGLDLDVTSKSGVKEKLDLKLLTTTVVFEIHKFVTTKQGHYYPDTLFDILDYNFDLSSQHCRRWEFSLATTFRVQALVKEYCEKREIADKVFQLPLVFPPKTEQRFSEKTHKNEHRDSSQEERDNRRVRYHSVATCASSFSEAQTKEETLSHDENTSLQTDSLTENLQMNETLVSVGCGSTLQGNMQVKEEEDDPYYRDIKPELHTNEKYHPDFDFIKTESNTMDVHSLVPGKPVGSDRYVGNQDYLPNPKSCDIPGLVVSEPYSLATYNSNSLPTVDSNLDALFSSQHDESMSFGSEEQTETLTNSPNESDTEQDELRSEYNLNCPLREPDLSKNEFPDSKNAGYEQKITEQNPTSSDMRRETESSFVIACAPLHMTTDSTSSLPTVTLKKDHSCANQSDERKLCEREEQAQTLKVEQKDYDMEKEEMEQMNLSNVLNEITKMKKFGSQRISNFNACNASSSQAAIIYQKEGNFADMQHQEEYSLMLWKLRVSQITQILSMPHEEHCLLSFTRCKKLGIDFNVGSGVKQNLDPKLLTNGIMVELNTFAAALVSAQKHFITEILECNFDLNFENELYRAAFTQQIWLKTSHRYKVKGTQMQCPFELPDIKSLQKSTTYCPRCCQVQNLKLGQDECKTGYIHLTPPNTTTDTVHGDVRSAAETSAVDLWPTLSPTEKTLMDRYPQCEKIGLSLFVNKEQPKDKLDTNVLTCGAMMEVTSFAKKLCGTHCKVLNDLLKHNFDMSTESLDQDPAMFNRETSTKHDNPKLDEVFVFQHMSHRPPGHISKLKRKAAKYRNSLKETVKRRKLAFQTKDKSATLPMHKNSPQKKQRKKVDKGIASCYPICTKIGLHLDVTSKSREKLKLDLQLLTRGVVLEIHKFANEEVGHHYPRTVFDILDYNFDLSSQYYRRWEFSLATASKIQTMVKQYCEQLDGEDEVFTLPFEMDVEASQCFVKNEQQMRREKSSLDIESGSQSYFQGALGACLTSTDISSNLLTANSVIFQPFANQLGEKNLDKNEDLTQTPKNVPTECDMEQMEMEKENVWKLRARRVEQILSAEKEFGPFRCSSRCGIEFNVGFGPKQNISVDLLTNPILLEVAKFALAINSSQQEFIMEILEYNFDLDLQSQQHRNAFAFEILNVVRQLRKCKGSVKLSNEVFGLPFPMPPINMVKQSVGSASPELNSTSKMEKCDVDPVCPDIHAETYTHISHKIVDLYPHCKEIGLKLLVNNSQPNKKLDINKVTNGAMTEVAKFVEKLCGTFEQICLDILRHNFNLDLQSGDSDPTKDVLALITAAVEKKNLAHCDLKQIRESAKVILTMTKLDCQNNLNLDASSAGSSHAITDQDAGISADIEQQDEYILKLWQLRANQTHRILSIPHEENCPLYSFTRCKKLGIDFNVGSGVKQNLDPKLLTNGIMVELNTFAAALVSAQKHFITEILECNFDLNFENELYRAAFTQQIWLKTSHRYKVKGTQMQCPFELPDIKSLQKSTTYCPRCCQVQNLKLRQDECKTGYIHHPPNTTTDTVHGDVRSTAETSAVDLWPTLSPTEKTLMDRYPQCEKIGLSLFVNKEQPKDKLDTYVLTRGAMMEVTSFAKKLCGTHYKVLNDLLKHNFDMSTESLDQDPAMFNRETSTKHDNPKLDEVFVFQHMSHRPPGYIGKIRQEAAKHGNSLKETVKRRKLALQTKDGTLPMHDKNVQKEQRKKTNKREASYSICTKIGLDLHLTPKSGDKEKLDLKLLTRPVVVEIHNFANDEVGNYYPRTVFDILDYNFDLSSVHYRRWEFSMATASRIQTMVEQYCEQLDGEDEVFKLPFVMDAEASQWFVENEQHEKSASSSQVIGSASGSSCDTNMNPVPEFQPVETGFLRGNKQVKTRTAFNESNMEQEVMETENYYMCPLGDSGVDSDEGTKSNDTGNQGHPKNPKSSRGSDVPRESDPIYQSDQMPFPTSSDISCTLPTINSKVNLPFASTVDEKLPCRDEELKQSQSIASDECDLEQDEMETEIELWKVRSNRVEQILSALNKESGQLTFSKKIGIEFNVGFGPKQNISVDLLTNSALLECANFALAINSSQQDFIMEILEYNFDLGLQCQQHRNAFALEMMKRLRQQRKCDDAVKLSDEVFELYGPMPSTDMANQSVSRASPELSSISRKAKNIGAPVCPSDSKAETKTNSSCKSVDLYPACREIGLILHVNYGQPNKKLDISTLTNRAMTEVTDFADKLCGTFEQICLDILRHNFDLDSHNGDSDLARNILARIPAAIEKRNLSAPNTFRKKNKSMKGILAMEKPDWQSCSNLDACTTGSPQAAIIDQTLGNPAAIEYGHELNLRLWQLREKQIQRILSIPHEGHCPFYSYFRCKKLGIDFNVGSGVKQNLDPKLLTNGIMVELTAFATALALSLKQFITEILMCNFDLNFKDELHRSAFTRQTWDRMVDCKKKNRKGYVDIHFELPDMRHIQELSHTKTIHCPKCHQDRTQMLSQDESDDVHTNHPRPRTVTGTDSPNAKCTAQKNKMDPSSTATTIEEIIMDSYPLCKEIGLNLFMDKEHPKLGKEILNYSMMLEVASFAKTLSGTKSEIVLALLEHNFNICMQISGTDLEYMIRRVKAQNNGTVTWLSEVFVFHPICHKQPKSTSQVKIDPTVQKSTRMETIQKRRLALQMKEKATLPSCDLSIGKPNKYHNQNMDHYFPICGTIGLDLDVTSKSEVKEKLDLKLLTTAVVFEIHKFATSTRQYFPGILFDILDYNFDLSSQHHRRWEFSIETASKVQILVRRYRKTRDKESLKDKVFILPFVFPPKCKPRLAETKPKHKSKTYFKKKRNEGNCAHEETYQSDPTFVHFFEDFNPNTELWSPSMSWTHNWEINESVVSEGCGSPLLGNMQIKEEECDPYYGDIKTELDTDENYQLYYDNVKMEINTGDFEHSATSEPLGSHGYNFTTLGPNSEGDIKTESETESFQ